MKITYVTYFNDEQGKIPASSSEAKKPKALPKPPHLKPEDPKSFQFQNNSMNANIHYVAEDST